MPAWLTATDDQQRHCSQALLSHFGCVVAVRGDGKSASRATVTFVRLDGRHLLMTAAHVASALCGLRCQLLTIPRDEAGQAPLQETTPPEAVGFNPDILCASKELDIAFLHGPRDFNIGSVRWFDLDEQRNEFLARRIAWPSDQNSSYYPPSFVCGYPNFSALENEEERVQLMGGGPRQCEIASWDNAASFEPLGVAAPQMRCSVFMDRSAPSPEIEQAFEAQLDQMKLAFGGYSGGPIVYMLDVEECRFLLLGTIKEGGKMFSEGRVFGTSIDVSESYLRACLSEQGI